MNDYDDGTSEQPLAWAEPPDTGPRYGSPWPAPDPAHAGYSTATLPSVKEHSSARHAGRLLTVVVTLLALLLGAGAAVAVREATQDRPASSGAPTTTLAPSSGTTAPAQPQQPTTAPTTGPATTTPAAPTTPTTTPSGASTPASGSTLDVGIVDIETVLGYDNGRAAGTGMILTSSGEVLTNHHVVSGATDIKVTVVTTGKTYDATVLGVDSSHDVALLKLVNASGLRTVRLGDSAKVDVGDAVTAVGNAGGRGGTPEHVTGEVTGLDQNITVSDEQGGNASQLEGLIETSAPLRPGDSGGAMYNAKGEVIGMNTAGQRTSRRFNPNGVESYVIPINDAMAIADDIRAGRASDTIQLGLPAFLGIEIDSSGDAQLTNGVEVANVISGTPAAKAGIKSGSVITAVDGRAIATDEDLRGALQSHKPGEKATITWTDSSGTNHTATVTLVEGPVA